MKDLSFRPSTSLRSVSKWIRNAVAQDVPVTREQMLAWADAFDASVTRAREIEELAEQRQADRADRLNPEQALHLAAQGSQAIQFLAVLAADAATRAELLEIHRSAHRALDAYEGLALGVVRTFPKEDERHG